MSRAEPPPASRAAEPSRTSRAAEPSRTSRAASGAVVLHPLDLRAGTESDVGRSVREAIEDVVPSLAIGADTGATDAGVVVLDATLVGPRVPARARVVTALRRADTIVAEALTAGGVVRLVRVGSVDLVDAGAQEAEPGMVAFPPEDPRTAAAHLRDALGAVADVVLASRATPDRLPVALAVGGDPAAARYAPLLAGSAAPAVLVTGISASGTSADQEPAGPDVADPSVADRPPAAPARRAGTPRVRGGFEAVRAAFGVRAGTPAAVEVGLPAVDGDDVEARITRACRLAARPFPDVPDRHPVRKHLRSGIDLGAVTMTTLQIGVQVDAPDDLTLGAAVGRLVVALAGEGIVATPIRHETGSRGPGVLVAFLADEG